MKRWALLCGVMLLFAGIASAQDDKVTVFGGYSYVHADTTGLVGTSTSFNGGSGSIAYKPIPLVSVVADRGVPLERLRSIGRCRRNTLFLPVRSQG